MRCVAVFVLALVVPLAGTTVGCGPSRQQYGSGILHYSENARRSYEDALVAFKDRDWLDASAQLREVRRKFSFSGYAPLAQVRLADIEFEQEKWSEGIAQYRAFVRENPKHPETAWARMRIARSFYNQISDAFLLPAQEERDQSAVIEATREIKAYVTEFPKGPQHDEMVRLGADALARLVGHELYVARFYMNKGKLEAALARALFAVQKYKGSVRDVEALVVTGEILLMLKRRDEARSTFELVVRRYPNDPRTVQARAFLARLEADEG